MPPKGFCILISEYSQLRSKMSRLCLNLRVFKLGCEIYCESDIYDKILFLIFNVELRWGACGQ